MTVAACPVGSAWPDGASGWPGVGGVVGTSVGPGAGADGGGVLRRLRLRRESASSAVDPAGGVRDPDPAEDGDGVASAAAGASDAEAAAAGAVGRGARHRREPADELVVGERLVHRGAQRASDVGAGGAARHGMNMS